MSANYGLVIDHLREMGYSVTAFYDDINDCDWFMVACGDRLICASNDEEDAWHAAAEDAGLVQ